MRFESDHRAQNDQKILRLADLSTRNPEEHLPLKEL